MSERKEPLIITLISARGGSIRLPRKNAKNFLGHPLVAWSIIQSRCSNRINGPTFLSTDDEEIAQIGKRYGATVLMRPVWDNDITLGVAFDYAMGQIHELGVHPDEIVTILPTSPIKKPNDLDDMIWAFHYNNNIRREAGLESEPVIITTSPDREMFVYKNIEDVTNAYGIAYHTVPVLCNKFWNYSKLGGGWNVSKADFVEKEWRKVVTDTPMDSVIDKSLDTLDYSNSKPSLSYSIETWQCFETDYESDFKLCEAIMEAFVLQGRGMKVYTDYAREFRKIVEYDDGSNKVVLPDAFGNIRQMMNEEEYDLK